MSEEGRGPIDQEAPTTSETPEIPEIVQKCVETYKEVATVLASPKPVINNYT